MVRGIFNFIFFLELEINIVKNNFNFKVFFFSILTSWLRINFELKLYFLPIEGILNFFSNTHIFWKNLPPIYRFFLLNKLFFNCMTIILNRNPRLDNKNYYESKLKLVIKVSNYCCKELSI